MSDSINETEPRRRNWRSWANCARRSPSAIVGQDAVVEQLLIGLLAGGHCLLEGVPGPGQDLAGALARAGAGAAVPAHPVHPRPDAQRHPRHRDAGRGPRHRPAPLPLPARPGVHQPAAGRRAQPHAAQDPGRAAGGDAGTHRQLRRRDPRAAGAVLRAGDAEPARAGRHLSAAGSAARPLPAAHPRRLSERGRGARHPGADHRRAQRAGAAGDGRRGRCWRCRRWCAKCTSATTCWTGSRAWCAPAARGRRAGGSARVGEVGRRPARRPVAGAGGQGARAAARPAGRDARGRASRWPRR